MKYIPITSYKMAKNLLIFLGGIDLAILCGLRNGKEFLLVAVKTSTDG